MSEILKLYNNIFEVILGRKLSNGLTNTDPTIINKTKFYSRGLVLIYIYVSNKTSLKNITLSYCKKWLVNNISSDCLFSNIIDRIDSNKINEINEVLAKTNIDVFPNLGVANEQMLTVKVGDSSTDKDKNLRNQQGSYYSPTELVYYLVKLAVDRYIKLNGIEKLITAKIADFSCGDGIFLTTALCYIRHLFQDRGDKFILRIVSNIYACDVDCLALELAKLNILDLVGDASLYDVLSEHFCHANFLLQTVHPESDSKKLELYSEGYIYHHRLAIGVDFLQEYDIILGNPPWEKIRFEEVPFYSQFSKNLGKLTYKDERIKEINSIEARSPIVKEFATQLRKEIDGAKKAIKSSPFFQDSATGELNTCSLFLDACFQLVSTRGVIGLIIKSSSITAPANKKLFNKIKAGLVEVIDFINSKRYFTIDNRERFALISLDRQNHTHFKVAMNVTDLKESRSCLCNVKLNDLQLLNPKTGMLPNLTNSSDLRIILNIYRHNKTIGENFPYLKYGRLVHLTNHAKDIDRVPKEDNIPIYEGKFFSVLNGRYSGFNDVSQINRYKGKAHSKPLTKEQLNNGVNPESRFFIKRYKWNSLSRNYNSEFMLAWHSLSSATNGRACVSTLLPFIPASQSVQFLICEDKERLAYLTAIFSSVTFDFVVKNKMTGIDLTQSIINQVAIPSFEQAHSKIISMKGESASATYWIISACAQILKSDNRLNDFWKDLKTSKSFESLSRNDCLIIIDGLAAYLYGLTQKDFLYILTKYSNQYNSEEITTAIKWFDLINDQ